MDHPSRSPFLPTHEVKNQPPPLVGHDLFRQDRPLVEAFVREGGGVAEGKVAELGVWAGTAEAQALGHLANAFPPQQRTHDRFGHRIDEVEFHPAYHQLMRRSLESGLNAYPLKDEPGAHVRRAAGFFIGSQVEAGHGCPISMTYAAIPALAFEPKLHQAWAPKLTAPHYEPGLRPAAEKSALLCGMGMTEKQGGSDVRANTTVAEPVGDGEYALTGHKWFCSAPMCDAFLMLAQAKAGLTCFLVPRVLPDGARNRFLIQRLKDKLGNRSNASSEVELVGAWAQRVGEEGRGVRTIIEMVNLTRLDCIIGSAGLMRQALTQAVHHATYRHAFGKALIDQPLMKNVLADLALESEAATLSFMRLARACDQSAHSPSEALLRRLATAVCKYWVCKRAPTQVVEALECLGGNGYVEEGPMPRLYREAPLNSIWEGSGNVNALDLLRAAAKEPASIEAFFAEVELARGGNAHLDAHVHRLKESVGDFDQIELRARALVEALALAFQASLLVRHAPAAVADAFCASRLGGQWGHCFGTLPKTVDHAAIVERAKIALPS